MTENEVEDKLTSFITVFKYIDDKDVFQKVNNHTEDHCTFIFPLGEYFCYTRKSELLLFFNCSSMPECWQKGLYMVYRCPWTQKKL